MKPKIITDYRIPIYIYATNPEEEAMQQAINLANLSVTFDHIANMPDMHKGYGMPIGGVCACKDAIIPYGVGNDGGCGMHFILTNLYLKDVDQRILISIRNKIKQKIPVGYKHHSKPQEWEGFNRAPDIPIIQRELESAKRQLGTLGSGNHFIEIQRLLPEDRIAIMIHSGSRNFGYKICQEYHTIALRVCQERMRDTDLAYLRPDKPQGQEYITAMNYALEFARANRYYMMSEVMEAIKHEFHNVKFSLELDVHHNYASLENHFGEDVWVHRKGATSAMLGQYGIIPGDQGSSSYIVMGKGNPDSFSSCSHGAGRCKGRNQASRDLNVEEETKKMEGIIYEGWGRNKKGLTDLGEAPGAYKDIGEVMNNQEDLVDTLFELKPVVNVKAIERWKNKKQLEENDYTQVKV